MKIVKIILLIILSGHLFAQKSMFVRVYNVKEKKIVAGHISAVTDTSLVLYTSYTHVTIPVRTIGLLKTKHSGGMNVFYGAMLFTVASAIIGIDSYPKHFLHNDLTTFQRALSGVIIGLPLGAMIGGISIQLKHSKSYRIDGDLTRWNGFKNFVMEKDSEKEYVK